MGALLVAAHQSSVLLKPKIVTTPQAPQAATVSHRWAVFGCFQSNSSSNPTFRAKQRGQSEAMYTGTDFPLFGNKIEQRLSSSAMSGQKAIDLQMDYDHLHDQDKPAFVMALIQALERHLRVRPQSIQRRVAPE